MRLKDVGSLRELGRWWEIQCDRHPFVQALTFVWCVLLVIVVGWLTAPGSWESVGCPPYMC